MASTPKAVRRTAKKIRREVSNYFGFPVRARVNFGVDNSSQTHVRGSKAKGVISLDRGLKQRGKIPLKEVRKILRHEFFHVAGDSYMLEKVSNTPDIPNEAIAMIANAEHQFSESRDPNIYKKFIAHQENILRTNPPKHPLHQAGLVIMLNILRQYPTKKERQIFVRELLKQNAEAIEYARRRNLDFCIVTPLGKIIPQLK
jgi:hypothetical protein